MRGESVQVPFYVNGTVKVTRVYPWVESWKDLTRQVAADLNNAPALALKPVEVKVDGQVGSLCVDTGSPNGSVVVHFHKFVNGAGDDGSLLGMLLHSRVRVTRSWWAELAAPYPFELVPYPER